MPGKTSMPMVTAGGVGVPVCAMARVRSDGWSAARAAAEPRSLPSVRRFIVDSSFSSRVPPVTGPSGPAAAHSSRTARSLVGVALAVSVTLFPPRTSSGAPLRSGAAFARWTRVKVRPCPAGRGRLDEAQSS